jgi:GT2 family glycosyltransferase
MLDLIVSVVRYNQPAEKIQDLAKMVAAASLSSQFWLIDNSEQGIVGDFANFYIKCPQNIGFGAGHNIAMRASIGKSKYHLVLNPDISFRPGTLERLFDFMEANPSVGIAMPKIFFPDGSPQLLCNLIPSSFDLFVRRFGLIRFFKNRHRRYEMQNFNFKKPIFVPFLSGCFLFIRVSVFGFVGFFDERFFLYMEDLDFSRRVEEKFLTVCFPGATVTHEFSRGSYKEKRLFFLHLVSAIKYFCKWGWIFDSKRLELNRKAISFRTP